MCVWHICTCVYAYVSRSMCLHRVQRMSEILLYQSVPYSPEIGSLSVLGARLAASKPSGHPVSAPHSMSITSTYNLCLPVLHGFR